MKNEIYKAIYRLFEEGSNHLTIKVGQLNLRLYDNKKETNYVWDFGVTANGQPYTVGALYSVGLGPGTYAELFAGEYDIIQGLTEEIYKEEFGE